MKLLKNWEIELFEKAEKLKWAYKDNTRYMFTIEKITINDIKKNDFDLLVLKRNQLQIWEKFLMIWQPWIKDCKIYISLIMHSYQNGYKIWEDILTLLFSIFKFERWNLTKKITKYLT